MKKTVDPILRRERFYQDVNRAWYNLREPWFAKTVGARSAVPELGRPIWLPDLSLSMATVSRYRQNDFADLAPETRRELHDVVRSFRAFVQKLPQHEASGEVEREQAIQHFESLISIVKRIVLDEWTFHTEALIADAEKWSVQNEWPIRRETRTVSEGLLGEYIVPRLLFYAEVRHVLLEPVARFVAGAFGLADLMTLPSYSSIKIIRATDEWKLSLPLEDGSSDDEWHSWNPENFKEAVTRLKYLE